jgi:hypothetical protein
MEAGGVEITEKMNVKENPKGRRGPALWIKRKVY